MMQSILIVIINNQNELLRNTITLLPQEDELYNRISRIQSTGVFDEDYDGGGLEEDFVMNIFEHVHLFIVDYFQKWILQIPYAIYFQQI